MSNKYLLHFIARGITTAAHLSLQIFSSNPYGSFCLSYISRILNILTTIHSRQSIRTKGGASSNSSRGSSETRVNMNNFKDMTGLQLFQWITSFWHFKVANYGLHAWFGLKTYKWWDFDKCQSDHFIKHFNQQIEQYCFTSRTHQNRSLHTCAKEFTNSWSPIFPKHCNEMIEPGVVVQRALSGGSREGWAVFKFPAVPRLWLAQQGGAGDRLAQGVSHLPWQGLAQQLLHPSLLSLSISSLLLAPVSAQCAKKENETKTRNNMSCTLPKNLF